MRPLTRVALTLALQSDDDTFKPIRTTTACSGISVQPRANGPLRPGPTIARNVASEM